MSRPFLLFIVMAVSVAAQELDKATLDLSLIPPLVNTNPGAAYDDAVRPGNMVIGIDRTPKGRLWAAWIGNGDSPNGFLMLASSDDAGKTWSKPRVVIDPVDLPGKPNLRTLVELIAATAAKSHSPIRFKFKSRVD